MTQARGGPATDGSLVALSDLHVGHQRNRELLTALTPGSPTDWLIVAGDVAERVSDVRWALDLLSQRFARVIWAPGNHELWTTPRDPWSARGEARYRDLVEVCRRLGVVTPEDPYPVWNGPGGPVTVAPLFVLYDYSFLPEGATTKEEALEAAYARGVVCTDEALLHHDPHDSREAWCAARVAHTERSLSALAPGTATVLVNHFPLIRAPTRALRHPHFALWCGTERTADWHVRFNAAAVIYGHLHIRRTTWHDRVPFFEVSVGYPREWSRDGRHTGPVAVLPTSATAR